MSVQALPLKPGDTGGAVRDLHRRLIQAGYSTTDPLSEIFSADTEQAVRTFQDSRRIEVDGIVGRHTWTALDEAAHRLGDRLLYHKSSPMIRGDDVAELQQRLGALGFDAGRVDGIFGPDSAQALQTFQRNAGLPTDGICGPGSIAALRRLGGREDQANVAEVKERARLRDDAERQQPRRVALGEWGGLGSVVDTCSRQLRHRGMRVEALTHPDESYHARLANALGVDLFIALAADEHERCTASYFSTTGFDSSGGLRLAELLIEQLRPAGFADATTMGQRLPVLRETRMTAVLLRIGPIHRLVRNSPAIGTAIADAVGQWILEPSN